MPCLTLARPIEVLLVDDQRAILAGVTALIDSATPWMHVTGHALNGEQALQLASSLRPRVILLDVNLGDANGLDLIPALKRCCDAALVVFTCVAEPALRRRAHQLGAAAFIPKTASGDELIAAICAVTSEPRGDLRQFS